MCPHFASAPRRVLSPNIRFSLPASRNLNFQRFPVASLESAQMGTGLRLVICFHTHVETPPCSALAPPWLSESLISCGASFFALYDTKVPGLGFDITKFIDLGFAIAELSWDVPSCPLFDTALHCFLFEKKKWLQENIGKFIMFNKTEKRVPLITCEASFGTCRQIGSWSQHI